MGMLSWLAVSINEIPFRYLSHYNHYPTSLETLKLYIGYFQQIKGAFPHVSYIPVKQVVVFVQSYSSQDKFYTDVHL